METATLSKLFREPEGSRYGVHVDRVGIPSLPPRCTPWDVIGDVQYVYVFDFVFRQKSEVSSRKGLTHGVTAQVICIEVAYKASRQSRVEFVISALIVGLGISITDHRYATPDVVFDKQMFFGVCK